MNKIIKALYYIVETIFYGAKELTIGLALMAALFAFMAVLIIPPMYSFDLFVQDEPLYGSLWLIITLYVYGVGLKKS